MRGGIVLKKDKGPVPAGKRLSSFADRAEAKVNSTWARFRHEKKKPKQNRRKNKHEATTNGQAMATDEPQASGGR